MIGLLYICGMSKRWSTLKPLDSLYIINNYGKKNVQQIANDLDATTDRVRRVLKMNGVKMMGKSELYASIKELKFNYEEQLCLDYKNGYTQNDLMKKYKIGNEKVVLLLERNNIDRIKGKGGSSILAWKSGRRKPSNVNKGGTKDIHNALYGRWKNNAKSRSYPFNVTIKYLQNLLEKQDYKCALTNMIMLCPKNYIEKREMTSSPYLLSLDRIENDLGYIEGNVQFTCVWANKARGSYENELFKEIINKLRNV
jgi:hypothetical protein